MLLIHHFQAAGWSYEDDRPWPAPAIYLLVRFGGTHLLQLLTDHRGMFHSIPAALIFGELAYLAASGDEVVRAYKAGAVIIGFMSHLFLDEVYSVQWSGGKIGLKSSFGTALKILRTFVGREPRHIHALRRHDLRRRQRTELAAKPHSIGNPNGRQNRTPRRPKEFVRPAGDRRNSRRKSPSSSINSSAV